MRELVVRILDDPQAAAQQIAAQLDVAPPIVDGELIRFEFSGDVRAQAEFIGWLVGQGHAVAEVRSHKKSLEDVFLHVTEGLVQ